MCHLSPLSGFDSVLSSAGGWIDMLALSFSIFKLHSKRIRKRPINLAVFLACVPLISAFTFLFFSLQRSGFRHHKKGTGTDYAVI